MFSSLLAVVAAVVVVVLMVAVDVAPAATRRKNLRRRRGRWRRRRGERDQPWRKTGRRNGPDIISLCSTLEWPGHTKIIFFFKLENKYQFDMCWRFSLSTPRKPWNVSTWTDTTSTSQLKQRDIFNNFKFHSFCNTTTVLRVPSVAPVKIEFFRLKFVFKGGQSMNELDA